ncbi:MAG: 2-isopropylmalate synthase [Planctomycetes bacterium]|nr:2-isopropylmalate synthase [Planctomycetota bacterium]
MDRDNLIYEWNKVNGGENKPPQRIEFDDETLRDGLQSPSVKIPPVDTRIKILHFIDKLGIDTADVGLPGAGGKVREDTLILAKETVTAKLKVTPNCAARTLEVDVRPILEISQKIGRMIESCLFLGSSPIRMYAEGWDIETMLKHTRESVTFATKNGLPVMFVTEDTTRADPETLKRVYLTAIECGAKRICLADTVGYATPWGAFQLVTYIKKMLKDAGVSHIKIDYHGHMDRGLGVWNSISAIVAGADRVHATAICIGERVGNTPMDQLLINLRLMGWIDNDLTHLYEYCKLVSESVGVPIPSNYPVVGKDAFETATGVHASAVIKAMKKNDQWLADRVYSSVPSSWVGRKQLIRVGPLSGKSNIVWWLTQHGYDAKEELVNAIFEKAKVSNRLFTDEEMKQIAESIVK